MLGIWWGARWRRGPLAQIDMRAFEVDVQDVSQTGVRFACRRALAVGQRISVELPRVGAKTATVAWRRQDLYGCDFVVPLRFQDVPPGFLAHTLVAPIA